MKRFSTLLQREWMQHRLGWMILMSAPLLVGLAITLFSPPAFHFTAEGGLVTEQNKPLAVAAVTIAGTMAVTLALSWMTVLFQLASLARRDRQDRSIEFWLSLPVGHAQGVAAPLTVHLLLVPWAALCVGLLGGGVLSLLFVTKLWGLGSWLALPWGSVLAAELMLLLRLLVGVALATLWLSPLILSGMAASAWLKGWGVPALIGLLVGGGAVLEKVYGLPQVRQTLSALGEHAAHALIATKNDPLPAAARSSLSAMLQAVPGMLAGDAVDAVAALASPLLLGGLLVAGAAFALLIVRRQRGA
ncbi:MAG: hypothetical protein HY021_15185 [Burkholderiales bacterium]|nr:hypothetical protein [Burkholderiales bacterium]